MSIHTQPRVAFQLIISATKLVRPRGRIISPTTRCPWLTDITVITNFRISALYSYAIYK